MKSFWLAFKIAAAFLLVMLTFVVTTLHLFARNVMHLHGGISPGDAHNAFITSVMWVALLAVATLVALSVYVTAPLRRMSRSMDRIAAGDLEHRVAVRGRDEGAAMGRSFNAMAERIRGMIVGQKELMAGVSHELRSPLARMKVSLELMREGRTSAKRIADLEADVDEIDSMVEEVLLASRLDLGTAPLAVEPLDLAEACREAWARVATVAETHRVTLELSLGDAATRVQANRNLAVRLLGNLFENSVRYAARGRITVASELREDRVHIEITDDGPGVDEADLERLFEPFFRADRSRSRKTGAGGLGLMIVRRAVEAHGGRVRARGAQPRGLEIALDLPRVIE